MRSPDLSPDQRGEPTTEQVDASLRLPEPMNERFLRLTGEFITLMRERNSWQIPSIPLDTDKVEMALGILVLGWFSLCESAVTTRGLLGETEESPDLRLPGLDFWNCCREALGTDEQETMRILQGARRAFSKLVGREERMKPYDTHRAERLVEALWEYSVAEDST